VLKDQRKSELQRKKNLLFTVLGSSYFQSAVFQIFEFQKQSESHQAGKLTSNVKHKVVQVRTSAW
jgi:hypothetical protein